MPLSPTPNEALTPKYRFIRYFIALCFGATLALFLVALTWRYLVEQKIEDFHTLGKYGRDLVNQRLISTDEFLGSIASYIDVMGTPDSALFRGFLNEALTRHDFIKAAYYLPMVPHQHREKFEKEMSAGGYVAFSIKASDITGLVPAPNQSRYFPILLLEPFSPLSARMIGVDVSNQTLVAKAIKKAAASAEVVKANIRIKATDGNLWLIKAIYSGRDIPTDEQRRLEYINGLVALEIAMPKLLASERSNDIELTDNSSLQSFNSDLSSLDLGVWNQDKLAISYKIERPGYDLHISASQSLNWSPGDLLPVYIAAILGVVITFLFLLITTGSLRRQESLLALRESERRLTLLMSNLPGMAYRRLHDNNWTITFASEGALGLTGYSAQQLVVGETQGFKGLIAPGDHEEVQHRVTLSLAQNQPFKLAYRIVTSDHRLVWVLEYGKGVANTMPAIIEGIVMDISERKQAEDEIQQLNETLETRVKERTHELQVANEDLSQTLHKLQSAQAQLIESEKMAALGSVVAGVAHEINTPIGIGVTAASTLCSSTKQLADNVAADRLTRTQLQNYQRVALESGDIILKNLQRAANLIQSFKEVAVDQSSEQIRTFNVKQYIEEVLLTTTPRLKKAKHEVKLNCSEELYAHTYPSAIYQILTNLLMNSVKHGFKGTEHGKIEINIFKDEKRENLLVLDYFDNGHGITKDVQGKIFQPFFTTARNEGGSGLGMHVAYNLVTQKLKGKIQCIANTQKGAHFLIEIPYELGVMN